MWDHRASKDLDHTRRAAFMGPFSKICLFVTIYFCISGECYTAVLFRSTRNVSGDTSPNFPSVRRWKGKWLIVHFWVDSPFKPWLKTLMFNSLTFSSVNETMSTQEAGLVGQLATTLIQTLLCICINTSSSSSSSSYCLLYIAPSHISKQF